MTRTQILNKLANKFDLKNYLEIGVEHGGNFAAVVCENKVGVDPSKSSKATIYKTSDDYFESCFDLFDLIFIDGLHVRDQVYRDAVNAMDHLDEGGFIVFHDLNPTSEHMQVPEYHSGAWTGDCWKAWVDLRQELEDWSMLVVDTDFGCGVMWRGKSLQLPEIPEENMTYENFVKNKKEWLNLLTVENFNDIIDSWVIE